MDEIDKTKEIKAAIEELLKSEQIDYSRFTTLSNELLKQDREHVRFSVDAGIINLSMARVNRWFEKFDILITRRDKTEVGARTMMRAIESNDTGFLFKGQDRQIKISQLLKNREVFAKLCTDTMRVMKKHLE